MSKHLEDVNMNYTMHWRFAWILALKLLALSLIALVHGIFPSIWVQSVSSSINKMSDEFRKDDLSRTPH
jgi:hypothetical protein